jgi:alpha-tubulin suppressor-like RCC1 family protein
MSVWAALARLRSRRRPCLAIVASMALVLFATPTGATANAGAVLAWGENEMSQLGGETPAASDVPIPVGGLSGATAVAAGGKHSLALLSNGTVVGWGGDGFGELGTGFTASRVAVPTPVSGLNNVTAIAAGHKLSLALLSNGTVMSWGNGQYGKLGNGTEAQASDVPVPVKGLSGATAISAGFFHSLALLRNGTVMAWGNGDYGELGNGGTSNSDVPVQVSGLTGVKAISAGGIDSLALMGDGTVMAWGGDEYGQLGLGERITHRTDVPVRVVGLSGVRAISAGMFYNLALLSNGTVMAWGYDHSGQLGNGTADLRPHGSPVPVQGLREVKAIAASNSSASPARTNQHSMALLSNGTVMSWGGDEFGQLGDGVELSSYVPVQVSGLSAVAAISAGGFHSLAIAAAG